VHALDDHVMVEAFFLRYLVEVEVADLSNTHVVQVSFLHVFFGEE